MRRLIAATCSAGVAVVVASPALAATPPPTVPSDAAIGQYIEVVPSATGLVPTGGARPRASGAALPAAVRAKVETGAGADAPALLELAQDPRFTPQKRPARAAPATPRHRADPAPAPPRDPVEESAGTPLSEATRTPNPLAAAASTAGSDELLLVALMLVAITGAGIFARAARR